MTTTSRTIPRLLCAGFISVLMTLGARSASAQVLAASFDQLRVLVGPGDTVSVTDLAGREVKGTVSSLTTSSLALLVKGASVEFREPDVAMVRQRRPDSLANGAKTGFFVGVGLGVLGALAIIADDDLDAAPLLVTAVLTYGGIGAGIGAGVDAMIEADRPIYSRSSGAPGRFALRPIAGRGRRGVAFAIRF